MGTNSTPRTNPTERELIQRGKRYAEPLLPLLVWIACTAVQPSYFPALALDNSGGELGTLDLFCSRYST
jgi:hypothetical protein